MEITVEGSSVGVEPLTADVIEVTVNDVDAGQLLSSVDISDVVSHYGHDALLDVIGKDSVIKHFEIEEKEE